MSTLSKKILHQMKKSDPTTVWTPIDFLKLGARDSIDKTLQRLQKTGDIRRISRGLYDLPRINSLTKKPVTPDYRSITEAIGRRDQVRLLVDGMTAANDLGLTSAVPGKVLIHTDGRFRPIQIGNLSIRFKLTSPSKLYWANRPAMRIVQALYWLRDQIDPQEPLFQDSIKSKLIALLTHPKTGPTLCSDLKAGFHTLPIWMQEFITELFQEMDDES